MKNHFKYTKSLKTDKFMNIVLLQIKEQINEYYKVTWKRNLTKKRDLMNYLMVR